MTNFTEVVENIDLESKKVNYDPEIGTNWCHLPMEMRMECIRHVDLKTRTHLGATSITEKSLVESEKIRFDVVYLEFCPASTKFNIRYETENEDQLVPFASASWPMLCLLERILKFGKINRFEFNAIMVEDESSIEETMSVIERNKPLNFESLSLETDSASTVKSVLESCGDVERIEFRKVEPDDEPGYINLGEFIDIPAMANAKHLAFLCTTCGVAISDVVDNWIRTDAKYGCCAAFASATIYEDTVEDFANNFADLVIKKDKFTVRLRMHDESKHILLKCHEEYLTSIVLVFVITANFPDPWEGRSMMILVPE